MNGHTLGVAAAIVGLAIASLAAFGLWGFWGLGCAAVMWLAIAALLVDPEAF